MIFCFGRPAVVEAVEDHIEEEYFLAPLENSASRGTTTQTPIRRLKHFSLPRPSFWNYPTPKLQTVSAAGEDHIQLISWRTFLGGHVHAPYAERPTRILQNDTNDVQNTLIGLIDERTAWNMTDSGIDWFGIDDIRKH